MHRVTIVRIVADNDVVIAFVVLVAESDDITLLKALVMLLVTSFVHVMLLEIYFAHVIVVVLVEFVADDAMEVFFEMVIAGKV